VGVSGPGLLVGSRNKARTHRTVLVLAVVVASVLLARYARSRALAQS